MEQRVFTISGLGPRTITPRDGRPSFTIWEVFDDQGGTWRVREDLYNQAQHWFGQRVMATTRTEQRGNFTNYYIDQMQPMGQGPVQQAQQAQPQQGYTGQPQPQAAPQPQMMAVSEWERQKQHSIHRQTAGKVAAVISKTADEFWGNVQAIFIYFETGQVPAASFAQQPDTNNRPNQAAYQPYDPGPQPGQDQFDDSDIPF